MVITKLNNFTFYLIWQWSPQYPDGNVQLNLGYLKILEYNFKEYICTRMLGCNVPLILVIFLIHTYTDRMQLYKYRFLNKCLIFCRAFQKEEATLSTAPETSICYCQNRLPHVHNLPR